MRYSGFAIRMIAALLCGFAILSAAQTQNAGASQDTAIPVIRSQSRLVVVRVLVVNKKAWRNGPSEAGERCVLASEENLFTRLSATQAYIPSDCDGLYIRDLTAKDFHIVVDGEEQEIQSVTSESEGLWVRDNRGLHSELSQTPRGRWSTVDRGVPEYYAADFAFMAQNRYDLSFVPKKSTPSGCHEIQVKVDRRSVVVAARDEYCDDESAYDLLNGSSFGKELGEDLASNKEGQISLSVQSASFESDKGKGRVRIVLEFPFSSFHWRWNQDWSLDAKIGILGLVYTPDGALVTRFSDFFGPFPYESVGELGMGSTTIDQLIKGLKQEGLPTAPIPVYLNDKAKITIPGRYETHLDLPPGEYDLRVALSDGTSFGRAKTHFKVEEQDDSKLALSSVMLSNRFRDAHVAEVERKAANFAPRYVPMVSKGVEFTPAGDTHFKADEPLIAYFEVHKPATTKQTAKIEAHLRILDAKSDELIKDFPPVDLASYEQPGSLTIPVAREVPFKNLAKGEYRLQVQVTDSTGSTTPWRSADFTVEPPPAPEESPFPASLSTIPEP